jgi:hypothetical protein
MRLNILVYAVLMLVGLAIGSFVWTWTVVENISYWWAGGIIGLDIGYIVAGVLMRITRKKSPTPTSESRLESPPQTPKPQAPKPQAPKPPARNEAITLLAALQREARFVDFIQESLAGYTDAQIGAAARDVHRDCGTVLKRMFALQPAVTEQENAEVEVAAGFDPGRWRLTGNVTGEPPFRGRLVHPGWEATACELPTWSGSPSAARIVAPAEVELK